MVSLIALMVVEILFWWLREYFDRLSMTSEPPKKIEADSRNKDNQQFPSHSLQKNYFTTSTHCPLVRAKNV
ncbi:hypothetical protein IP98_01615 [Flavobacterium cauense R2A-7]|uniref:Uncharacterized protein n=1 Tax=Flavobacterium cauense R2A-7 TaxID=1341154 RepID=A0A562LXX6_9FLAO|nr:hypothetical protein IP98_01615 [Flavobacterium cauense R2A-7]